MLDGFVSQKANNSLESYIRDQDKAWKADLSGETRVYLIKDKTDNIAMFFSIKCGLLVGENPDEILSDEHRDFVDALISIMRESDEDSIRKMYDAGLSMYESDTDRLFEIARNRLDSKAESLEIGQSENTIKVPICMPAIELQHFCKNENFCIPDDLGVSLGFGLFWEIIVPIIIEITKQVGCEYLYLFAADNTEDEASAKSKKLISYYKNVLKFSECDDWIKLIKPEYDNYCYGLIQKIADLNKNREAVWHEFSDIC